MAAYLALMCMQEQSQGTSQSLFFTICIHMHDSPKAVTRPCYSTSLSGTPTGTLLVHPTGN